jgi:hypothetical protein
MAEHIHFLTQNNKPNLVDYSLLQKLNSGSVTNPLPTFIQKAGSISFNLIKENLFMSIIIISLVLFLSWCYVEKKRQDKLSSKLMQKQKVKELLEEELQLFKEEPESVDVANLFKDINKDIAEVKLEKMEVEELEEKPVVTNKVIVVPRQGTGINSNKNIQISKSEIMAANTNSKYMDISNFSNTSFMLL